MSTADSLGEVPAHVVTGHTMGDMAKPCAVAAVAAIDRYLDNQQWTVDTNPRDGADRSR